MIIASFRLCVCVCLYLLYKYIQCFHTNIFVLFVLLDKDLTVDFFDYFSSLEKRASSFSLILPISTI